MSTCLIISFISKFFLNVIIFIVDSLLYLSLTILIYVITISFPFWYFASFLIIFFFFFKKDGWRIYSWQILAQIKTYGKLYYIALAIFSFYLNYIDVNLIYKIILPKSFHIFSNFKNKILQDLSYSFLIWMENYIINSFRFVYHCVINWKINLIWDFKKF